MNACSARGYAALVHCFGWGIAVSQKEANPALKIRNTNNTNHVNTRPQLVCVCTHVPLAHVRSVFNALPHASRHKRPACLFLTATFIGPWGPVVGAPGVVPVVAGVVLRSLPPTSLRPQVAHHMPRRASPPNPLRRESTRFPRPRDGLHVPLPLPYPVGTATGGRGRTCAGARDLRGTCHRDAPHEGTRREAPGGRGLGAGVLDLKARVVRMRCARESGALCGAEEDVGEAVRDVGSPQAGAWAATGVEGDGGPLKLLGIWRRVLQTKNGVRREWGAVVTSHTHARGERGGGGDCAAHRRAPFPVMTPKVRRSTSAPQFPWGPLLRWCHPLPEELRCTTAASCAPNFGGKAPCSCPFKRDSRPGPHSAGPFTQTRVTQAPKGGIVPQGQWLSRWALIPTGPPPAPSRGLGQPLCLRGTGSMRAVRMPGGRAAKKVSLGPCAPPPLHRADSTLSRPRASCARPAPPRGIVHCAQGGPYPVRRCTPLHNAQDRKGTCT